MEWTFLYLMVCLKLPIVALFYIVWWAVKQAPDPVGQHGGAGGIRQGPHPRRPLRPRGPRRDPHGQRAPASPPRMRTTVAHARQLER